MKRMLLLRVTSDACNVEVHQIQAVAKMHNMITDVFNIQSDDDFYKAVSSGNAYDYVYVAAHGNAQGIGGDHGYFIEWFKFAYLSCNQVGLNENCVFLLACCRGGLRSVALDIFAGCPHIEYVFGPRWTVTAPDITAGFHTFIYNMEHRKMQPDQAANRASQGTGYDFLCFDRVETELTSDYTIREAEVEQAILEYEASIDPDGLSTNAAELLAAQRAASAI